jgi:hypothetical protein
MSGKPRQPTGCAALGGRVGNFQAYGNDQAYQENPVGGGVSDMTGRLRAPNVSVKSSAQTPLDWLVPRITGFV